MNENIQIISTLIILIAFVLLLLATQVARRRKSQMARRGETGLPPFNLRSIPAYEAVPQVVGAAIEADRPIHLSFGSSGVGGSTTLLALAGAEAFYHITRTAAIGGVTPLLTMSESSALALGYGTLRRAFKDRGRLDRFNRNNVRWYPAGGRSMAFAAALTASTSASQAAGDILLGSFGAEIALILDSATRRRAVSVAVSDQLQGQAIAYVMADKPLIGEEVFVAGAYLGDRSAASGSVLALDTMRWFLIIGLLIATALLLRDALGIGG